MNMGGTTDSCNERINALSIECYTPTSALSIQ